VGVLGREVCRRQQCAGQRGAGCAELIGVRNEGEVAGSRFVNRSNPNDLDVVVTEHPRAECLRERAELHFFFLSLLFSLDLSLLLLP
jgi:hypothetical protein